MKIINSEFKKDENNHFEGKILVCHRNLDYIQEGLKFLLQRQYNFEDPADLLRYQEINDLYNDVFMLWEATTPVNSKDVDIKKLVTEDGELIIKEEKKNEEPEPQPEPEEPIIEPDT